MEIFLTAKQMINAKYNRQTSNEGFVGKAAMKPIKDTLRQPFHKSEYSRSLYKIDSYATEKS